MAVDGVHNMKIEINNELYDIDKGWTYIKNANETLDSAVVRISHLVNKLDIQPFDNVIINPSGDDYDSRFSTIYLCIDSYTETQVSLDPVIYNYEIHLFSETKKLENVILPNLSNTPRKLSTPLTIKQFMQRIWELYCPKNRGPLTLQNKYTFNFNSLPAEFNATCPELQWTTPTLRDVLNDLLMLKDYIVTMSNNTIGWMSLTKKQGQVSNYNFITRSRSSQDYATELKMNLQNILQEGEVDYKNFVRTYEFQTFTSNDYILNSDNLMLETQYPILNVKHLWMNWIIGDPLGTRASDPSLVDMKPIYIKVDLCNLSLSDDYVTENGINHNVYYSIVKEKKEYDILPVAKLVNNTSFGTNTASQYANCKNTCLYFTRGDNKIYGFSNVNKVSLMSTSQLIQLIAQLTELHYIKEHNLESSLDRDTQLSSSLFGTPDILLWSFPTFEIEYETTKEVVFSASKNELLRNERTIMDNQTNAWVNAEKQGNLEYQKANRIGNEVAMINQRTNSSPIDIFNYLGNEIVYRVEYQIFNDYIDVNAYATKDYILRDYFTGVNSKLRTWVNAQEEAFIRHDLYKYYVEIDEENTYKDLMIAIANDYYTELNIDNVVSAFNTQDFRPINFCLIKCDSYPAANKYYITNVITRIIGNSIVLTWGFNDNYVALKTFNYGTHDTGKSLKDDGNVDISDFDAVTYMGVSLAVNEYTKVFYPSALHDSLFNPNNYGGVPLQAFPYCNHDGNFTNMSVAMLSELTNVVGEGEEHTRQNYWDNIIAPVSTDISYEDPIFTFDAKVYKDNKEIITSSLQIEYINNSRKIYMFDNFLKLNHLIANEPTQALAVYSAPNLNATPTLVVDGQVIVSCYDDGGWNNNYSTLVQVRGSIPDQNYIYIYSGNTPLFRMTNDIRQFYINLLRKRDKEGLLS